MFRLFWLVFLAAVCLVSEAQTRMISHVTAPGGGFTTTVQVENQAVIPKTVTLTPYDTDGTVLQVYTTEVSGQGSIIVSTTEIFGEAAVSHFTIEAGESISVSVNYDFQSGNGSPAQVKESTLTSNSFRIFPGEWDVVFDGLAVVNAGEAASSVDIVQKNLAGEEIARRTIASDLAPFAKALFVIGSPGGSDFENPETSYFEVESAQPTAITALRGTLGNAAVGLLWANEILALPAAGGAAERRTISHLTAAGGGFTTSVILENHTSDEQSFRLNPFNAEGNGLLPASVTLAAGEARIVTATELLGDQASHFDFTAEPGVRVSVNYDFASGNGSPAHVRATAEQAGVWRIFPGDWEHVFDGLAIVNNGQRPTTIWITQKGFDDQILRTERIVKDLAPNAKALFVIGSPGGSNFSRDADSYFEVSSESGGMAITALRGTLGNAEVGLLWANEDAAVNRGFTSRDEYGVWTIHDGPTLYETFHNMGYNIGVDRMWQADTFRRRGAGTFAALVGSGLIDFDRLWRTILYSQEELQAMWNAMSEENKTIFQAYVDGMNRRIGQVNALQDTSRPDFDANDSLLPIEYLFFSVNTLDPWHPFELMSNTAAVQLNFTTSLTFGQSQIQNAALLEELTEKFGAEQAGLMFNDLRWINDPAAPTMIPGEATKRNKSVPSPPRLRHTDGRYRRAANLLAEQFSEVERVSKEFAVNMRMGSYAWVVSGDKTASGNPMIYSGPQMSFIAPSFIFEGAVDNDLMKVSGMQIAGVPGILVGRTDNHAWSFQVGHAPVYDYYEEDPEDIFLHRVDTIEVANAADLELEIYRSPRGVVFEGTNFAFQYAHRGRELDIYNGIYKMMTAQSLEEFGQGVANIGIGQHICYADKNGDIAYWMSGMQPERPEGDYRFPQGSINAPILYDVSNTKVPIHHANPAQGWYAGWNNKASADFDDVYGTWSYGIFHRAHAIQDILQNASGITFEDMKDYALQIAMTDSFNLVPGDIGFGGNLWPSVETAFSNAVLANQSVERNGAVAILQQWDGKFITGRENWIDGTDRADAWMLEEAWINQVLALTFDDELGELLNPYERFGVLLHALDPSISIQNNFDWFSNTSDPEAPQTANDIIVQALDNALADLGEQPWGTDQRGTIIHQTVFPVAIPETPFSNRSTYAQVVEVGADGPIRIESIHPLGHTGTAFVNLNTGLPVFDPHNFDLVPLYDAFQLRNFPLFSQ